MTRILAPLAFAAALASGPALAQDDPAPDAEAPGLFERGLGAMIGQLFGGDDPQAPGLAQDLSQALRQMGPVLQDLATQVDDVRNYQAPERLPNGDILIRRREDAPPPPPLGETLRPDPEPLADPDQPQIAL